MQGNKVTAKSIESKLKLLQLVGPGGNRTTPNRAQPQSPSDHHCQPAELWAKCEMEVGQVLLSHFFSLLSLQIK